MLNINDITSLLSVVFRIVAILPLAFYVLPRQVQEYKIEGNGLKKLKFYLSILTTASLAMSTVPIITHVLRIGGQVQDPLIINSLSVFNSIHLVVISLTWVLIYSGGYKKH